jgi:hypothetical protein
VLVRRIVVRDRINIPGCGCRPWRRAQAKRSMDNVIQVPHTQKKCPAAVNAAHGAWKKF